MLKLYSHSAASLLVLMVPISTGNLLYSFLNIQPFNFSVKRLSGPSTDRPDG